MTRLWEACSPAVDFVNGYKISRNDPCTGSSSAVSTTGS